MGMKQYGIVVVLAVLLHLITMQVAGLSYTPADNADKDECFISQAYSLCHGRLWQRVPFAHLHRAYQYGNLSLLLPAHR